MTKKTIIPTSTEDTMSFEAIIENLHKANSGMPDISESDKIGGKLTKNIVPLVDKAIKYAPKFEKELPREFNVQEVADAEALYNQAKENLLNVNRWGKFAGGLSAKFQLTDTKGDALYRQARIN